MNYGGISLTPRRIVAAINGAAGGRDALRVPRSHNGRCDLLVVLGLSPCKLVMEDSSWSEDALGAIALSTGTGVWIAPTGLVDAIVSAAGIVDSAERRAQILARLPELSWTRGYLRAERPNGDDPRQQKLW